MTRKDYVRLAAVLANARTTGSAETFRRVLARQFADTLAQDNPRFSRSTFLLASDAHVALVEGDEPAAPQALAGGK